MFDFTVVDEIVSLHSSLRTAEDRTEALGEVVKSLGEKLIPGIRNEVLLYSAHLVRLCDLGTCCGLFFKFNWFVYFNQLYPVASSYGGPIFFSLERAAAPYFGIKVLCYFISFFFFPRMESTVVLGFSPVICSHTFKGFNLESVFGMGNLFE